MNNYSTESLYRDLRNQLKIFINSKVRDNELAEDLLHDTFRKVHENLNTLKDNEKIVSWIYQIARNSINDYFRKKKITAPIDSNFPDVSVSDKIMERMQTAVKNMIDCMPSEYRDVLLATEYEGLTQKELAQKWGISIPGAKSRVQRARKKLKNMLFDCCHFEFDKFGTVIDYYQKNNSCTCCNS
jgi:RNA polymerase sigma-70 factor, ECF subfamily